MKLFVVGVMFAMVSLVVDWQEVKNWKPLLVKDPVKDASGADVTQPQKQSQQHRQGTNYIPPLLNNYPQSPTSHPGTDESGNKVKEKTMDTEWWMVAFTGGLLVVGVLQLILIGLQIRYGRKSVEAAVASARASEKSANIAETVTQAAERARLTVDRCYVQIIPFPETPGEIVCVLLNIGRTPATLRTTHLEYGVGTELPLRPDYTKIARRWEGREFIRPGDKSFQTITNPYLSSATWTAISDKEQRLFCYGRAVYDDVFGKGHYIEFFRQYDPGSTHFLAVSEPGYNFSDENPE